MSAALAAQSASPSTAPIDAPVDVNAYHGNYARPQSEREQRFNADIIAAYRARQARASDMEGSWLVRDDTGRKLLGLELRAGRKASDDLSGAWRSFLAGAGINRAGFISDLTLKGDDLEINYFAGHARSPTVLHLHKGADGQWSGHMLSVSGERTPIRLEKVHLGHPG
ncbi:hypothetical protein [Asticcacaulis sp. EMRT-3]|uniref:hypothetical protein n=1 Tax=Asticcacaulis sp. EMRT-3 TaxID=3040349 RepID=UPI0024AEA709|nr:hypothetical protein [Asticcacaulis sp. EMRT-3]MDI7775901.1 hypothetical protein [Asticcacaulis sp. EMRT-3]